MSHDTAAAARGLLPPAAAGASGYHATIPVPTRRRVSGLVVHRIPLRDPDVDVVGGALRLTGRLRTIVDCLCLWTPERGRELLLHGMRERLFSLDEIAEALRSAKGRNGVPDAWQVLSSVATGPWSEAERLFHDLLLEAGVTGWVANAAVRDAVGVIGLVDVLFEHARLVIEIDGRASHSDASAFQRDRERQNRLVAAGYAVLRFTWHDVVARGAEVVAAVRTALAAAARATGS